MLLDQHQQNFLLFLNCNKNHLRNVINVIYHAAVPSQLCRKVTVGGIQVLVVAKTLSRSVPAKGSSLVSGAAKQCGSLSEHP